MKLNIACIKGDGIGPEIVKMCIRDRDKAREDYGQG